MPCLSLRWLHSLRNCHSSEDQLSWVGIGSEFHPVALQWQDSRPDLHTKPAASHLSHASDLHTVLYWIQDAQIIAIGFNWVHGAFKSGLLYGPYCCHSDLDVCVCSIRHTPFTGHPHWYWSSPPYNTAESCSWPSWLPSSDLQHPARLWSRHRSGDCCLYRNQRLIHRGIHEISQLQPIWGQEIPIYGQCSEIQPLSDSYWCRQWQHPYHHCESGRAQPKPNPQASVWSLNGLVKSA